MQESALMDVQETAYIIHSPLWLPHFLLAFCSHIEDFLIGPHLGKPALGDPFS
jgi:hypothetical protein